jgi:hypothetical protein
MANPNLEEMLTETISRLFDETFVEVKGIYLDRGTSLFETLGTVSAEEASRPVSSTCASIAGQVEHVRFYIEVLVRYMRGEEVGEVDWDGSWYVQAVSAEEWEALVGRLRDAYRSVREVVGGMSYGPGDERFEDALAVVVHTAYHLGEIRQALCTARN